MTDDDVRRLALRLPEAEENSHFGKADFRVRGKIFTSLPETQRAVVKLMSEQQEAMAAAEPAVFSPVPGGWGRKGWTSVRLGACDEATPASALAAAWRNVAPRVLQKG